MTTLNGQPLLALHLVIPRVGAWTADVEVDSDAGPADGAAATLDLEGRVWRGTVVRGAAGTTAAAHSNGASLTRHVPPGLVRTLNIAEALVTLLQKSAGYIANSAARQETKKAQEWGSGLPDLRSQTYAAYGRKVRHRAV